MTGDDVVRMTQAFCSQRRSDFVHGQIESGKGHIELRIEIAIGQAQTGRVVDPVAAQVRQGGFGVGRICGGQQTRSPSPPQLMCLVA